MAGRSARHNRHDDPYTFDDPYRNDPPTVGHNVGYEYVGTDEATVAGGSPPPRYQSRRSSPQRRQHRATSLPRPQRHNRDPSPPQRERVGSPPRHSKQRVPPPPTDAELNAAPAPKRDKNYQARYQEWAQRPNVQRTKSYGKKGLEFMGSAAAAYLAAQQGKSNPRSRSVDRDMHPGRGSRHHSDRDDPPPRRNHRRDPSYSPSPPPRRSHHRRHDDEALAAGAAGAAGVAGAAARRRHGRHESSSPSPPRRRHQSYHNDDRDDRDRGRGGSRHHQRRGQSYSRSPSPSRHRDRGRPLGRSNTTNSSSSGLRHGLSESKKPPVNDAAARWQIAARAALEAGGVAAFRLRKEPGSWNGVKGAKVASAALGAAAMHALLDKDPTRDQGRGVKGLAENALGGIVASRMTGVKRNGKRR
ncbi:uncharacterized protein B0I36DRAFT_110997 [Microdochium trichocladiopsis]|uniref:Uncharacterized protein n=1 Tax=Microdochium trichocladiopsis TaxID=1682393 RepID=A0A9P8YC71_9PEZI|nr:uncharacterized protein B0I36DRAFT_110997 [Microdochium trichocladiopsis]KAH7033629.1 hypothetical protein B0I36DRAFT_110997 [Microdochium trichocladiopsis]